MGVRLYVRVSQEARCIKRATRISIVDLCLAWGALRSGQRRRLRKSWILFYETHSDHGLHELADGLKAIARTFTEFLRTCTSLVA